MCTCVAWKTGDHYFGRNLDLEYRFGEKVVITPRGYRFPLRNGQELRTCHAMIGMASVVSDYPLYAEATNEKGLSMAGLYFPDNACYFREGQKGLNLASFELIPYFLGRYASVAEVREVLKELTITDVSFSPELPATQLHWMIGDGRECIVMEQTKEGLKVYDNPVEILTNNPPFPYHLENVNNYMGLTPCWQENRFAASLDLRPYGNGMGTIGLPGDASPASRFVRAAFNRWNAVPGGDGMESVSQFFHILDSVAMVKGAVVTKDGKNDFTVYSCCMNASRGIYYYKTYSNSQITAVRMTEGAMSGGALTVYELREEQQVAYEAEGF